MPGISSIIGAVEISTLHVWTPRFAANSGERQIASFAAASCAVPSEAALAACRRRRKTPYQTRRKNDRRYQTGQTDGDQGTFCRRAGGNGHKSTPDWASSDSQEYVLDATAVKYYDFRKYNTQIRPWKNHLVLAVAGHQLLARAGREAPAKRPD